MSDKAPETEKAPAVHKDGDSPFDACDNRDMDYLDAQCRGLDLIQPLAHFWIEDESGEATYALTKSGVEEAGRLGGGVDCPLAGLRVEADGTLWNAEQEGQSMTTKLRRVGSASASILNYHGKPDRFGRRKAVSLAQRNAINALLTPEQKAKMITHAIDIGSVEQITEPWKKEDKKKRGRPAAGKAPGAPQKREQPKGRAPTKDEALDYFNSVMGEVIAAVAMRTDRDPKEVKRDMIRATVRRGTRQRFHNAEEMPLQELVALIRKVEGATAEAVRWLNTDEWEDVLETGGSGAELTKPTPAPVVGGGNTGATPPPPEPPDGEDPGPTEELPAGDAEKDAPDSGSSSGGSASGAGGELPDGATCAESNADADEPVPDEPENLDAARANAAEIVGRILKAVPVEGIGETRAKRQRAIDAVRANMTKAVVRTGTGGRTEDASTLTVAELLNLTALIARDERAIVKWLTNGRYLSSEIAPPDTQCDLLKSSTNPN